MKAQCILLGLVIATANCARPPWPGPITVDNDKSIVFPSFFEHPALRVASGGETHEMDGVVLKAIMIAMTDFLRPGSEQRPCSTSPEAHRYRVIRRENIIFVRIDEDLEACGLQYISVDSGVEYAISTDGRILRRIFDGEPEGRLPLAPGDGGIEQVPADSPRQPDGGRAPEAGAPDGG
jgi:hypothetical protein